MINEDTTETESMISAMDDMMIHRPSSHQPVGGSMRRVKPSHASFSNYLLINQIGPFEIKQNNHATYGFIVADNKNLFLQIDFLPGTLD